MIMSMELANPKLYKILRDATEDEKESWSKSFRLHRLHPLEFKDACSCIDCDRKITTLQDFEKNIIFVGQHNTHHIGNVQQKQHLCYKVSYTVCITIRILDMLHHNLKTLCENAGFPFLLGKSEAPSKFEQVDHQINQCLINAELIDASEVRNDDSPVPFGSFSSEIEGAMYWLGCTKAGNYAEPLLKQILEIEEKNLVEKQKTTPDYIFLKENIEKQIKLLEMIPVEVLVLEVKELIAQICPMDIHYMMSKKVARFLYDIDSTMNIERDNFWRKYKHNEVKGHNSNGLDQTLCFLIEKVDSFEKEWEREFASFYINPYNRSDPKSQETE